MAHGLLYYNLFPFLHSIPEFIATTIFIVFLIILIFTFGYLKLKKSTNAVVPDKGITLRNILDILCETLANLVKGVIGEHNYEKHLPLLGSIFIYVFISNFIGLIPGFLPPTSNINTNASCALIIFLYYNFQGIREHGFKYIKQFIGPFWWLVILFFPIELISHMARPFSLSVRLFANMNADHMVYTIFSGLVPPLLPLIFLGFGLFVCLVQAFVFTVLSSVYINLAMSHEH